MSNRYCICHNSSFNYFHPKYPVSREKVFLILINFEIIDSLPFPFLWLHMQTQMHRHTLLDCRQCKMYDKSVVKTLHITEVHLDDMQFLFLNL